MQYTLLSEFASFDVNKTILNSSNSLSVRLDSNDIDII